MSDNKLKIVLFFVFAFALLLCAACKPTPESAAVVNKSDADLEARVLEKADRSGKATQTADRIVWNETKTVNNELGKCTVTVSMDIDVPEQPGSVPVYLTEPDCFSIDFIKKAAAYLLKNEIYDGASSKQDVAAEILDFQQEVSSHTIIEAYQSEVDKRLEYLEEKYADVPKDNAEAKFEFTANQIGQIAMRVKSYLDDGSIMRFTASADKTGNCFGFYFYINEFNRIFYYLNDISGENIQANGIETTYNQALTIADNAMAFLFEEPFSMVHASITDKINDWEFLWNDGEQTSLGQAYVFYYSREYDDIPSLYINPAQIFLTEKTEYAKPYTREYVQIVVDDRGVVGMTYDSYSKAVEKLNDDVKLMPFEDILEQFKKDIFYHSLWGSADVTITNIEFGMVREPVKNNQDQYMMVPAWNFIGNVKSGWADDQEKSLLALNAIDGSIITDYEIMPDPK